MQSRVRKNSCFSHEIHTAIGGINVTKEDSSREEAVVFVSKRFIASIPTIWSSGSNQVRRSALKSEQMTSA